ncbi:hypothetical protein CDAR_494821 [Caerostris darwini]|uniref:Uncharacterized protein n=1 Tax=Caerostris darwini TaxID=1538125 RepID=A0AAV4QN74_9ARAC|nr:hypothetical protein CDAR_494821 [Caerostris darwini]
MLGKSSSTLTWNGLLISHKMAFPIFAIRNNVRSPFPMSQMHLSCSRRPLAPRIDLLIGGMFIDGNIFHSFGSRRNSDESISGWKGGAWRW